MKKLFSILSLIMILCSSVYADKILKSGYLIPTKKWADKININENFKIYQQDPINHVTNYSVDYMMVSKHILLNDLKKIL